MDVTSQLEQLAEPQVTARLHELLASARQRLSPWQRREMALWDEAGPFERSLLKGIRADLTEGARIRDHHATFSRRERSRAAASDDGPYAGLPPVLALATTKPAIASAVLWTWFGTRDADFASHLIQIVRERAGLPGLRRRISADDPALPTTGASLPTLVTWLADRQVEDACAWIEGIPAPFGPDDATTLADQRAAVERARTAAPRVSADEIAGFLRRAASFLVQISIGGQDPLGFPLGREVQLDADPPLERRIAIAAWARRSGHRISVRGPLFVLAIPVEAPWPLRLELIAAEPGHGQGGGPALLLRLDAGGTITVTAPAPVTLCLPGEPPAERGRRFERWLAIAYPHATQPWRAWS